MGSRFQNDSFQIPERLMKCDQVVSHVAQKSVNCTSYLRCTFRDRTPGVVAPRRTVHTVTRIWTTRGSISRSMSLSAKWVTTRCNYPQQEHIVSRSIHAYNGHDGSDPQVWKHLACIWKETSFEWCFSRGKKYPNTSAIGMTSRCNPTGNSAAAWDQTVWEKRPKRELIFYLIHFIISSRGETWSQRSCCFLLLLLMQNTETSLAWHVNSRMHCVRAGLLCNPECPELSWVRGTAGGISCARCHRMWWWRDARGQMLSCDVISIWLFLYFHQPLR